MCMPAQSTSVVPFIQIQWFLSLCMRSPTFLVPLGRYWKCVLPTRQTPLSCGSSSEGKTKEDALQL